ncbi:DUF4956 domain-containing protein [Diplocloster modestus]|uniref:DUF4956 domain-containing protein n=1 Tax=Diplocloster modestus TaxID=2850322 RepID=A0ABS6K920_9FIRM|nr:DUF4956 domain-containing protein [Diplocloster modestus]MBU9727007.1 DUF4956 domain-containing protein [Diplocloster modestus]
MSKKDILSWFYTNSTALTARDIAIILCIGLLCSAVIFLTYRFTYNGVTYNPKFNSSNVIILLITVVIMLMISSNIVISLGMVGALSIVRFRTAIKDPRDTVFIFWSIVEGLCVGSRNFKLALISVLFIALVIFAFHLYVRKWNSYLLVIRGTQKTMDAARIQAVLKPTVTSVRVKAVNQTDSSCEMILETKVKGALTKENLEVLHSIEGVKSFHWMLQTGETIG